MARIKVTGYLDTDDLDPDQVDTSHEMGLSTKGYEDQWRALSSYLDDIEFTLVVEE